MNFSKLNTTVLRQVLKLSERKEALLKELTKIETEIFAQLHGNSSFEATAQGNQGSTGFSNSKRLGRGVMKQTILQALAEAGSEGIKIPDLCKKINSSSASLHVWFTNVGKKLEEIEKVGPGHFRIRQ